MEILGKRWDKMNVISISHQGHGACWPLARAGGGPDLASCWETSCVYKPRLSSLWPGHLETAGALAGKL